MKDGSVTTNRQQLLARSPAVLDQLAVPGQSLGADDLVESAVL